MTTGPINNKFDSSEEWAHASVQLDQQPPAQVSGVLRQYKIIRAVDRNGPPGEIPRSHSFFAHVIDSRVSLLVTISSSIANQSDSSVILTEECPLSTATDAESETRSRRDRDGKSAYRRDTRP